MKIKDQKGVAAIEFAIVLPVLVVLLFATIEFGVLLFNKQVITNASREGARAGIVAADPRLTDGEISSVVTTYVGNNLITFGSATAPQILTDPAGNRDGLTFGADLKVTVSYDYDFLVLSNFGIGGVTLTSNTVMKME
jgi:Flp pilus assembly protein TadG